MLIAGNWKMNTDLSAARDLAAGVVERLEDPDPVKVAVCPPYISLEAVNEEVAGSPVRLGAQNMHQEDEGAYTGEVAAQMLTSVGCHYVILGHSERRQYYGEDDALVNEKVKKARQHGLVPIICVGETQEQRKAGQQQEVVREQVEQALDGVDVGSADDFVIAYEPVWAIGTGDTATPEQAESMHALIRDIVRDRFDETIAGAVDILYGGSMKPHNAEELLAQPDVDGGLIGGASLQAEDFTDIIQIAQEQE